jgi:hypothetical protein
VKRLFIFHLELQKFTPMALVSSTVRLFIVDLVLVTSLNVCCLFSLNLIAYSSYSLSFLFRCLQSCNNLNDLFDLIAMIYSYLLSFLS